VNRPDVRPLWVFLVAALAGVVGTSVRALLGSGLTHFGRDFFFWAFVGTLARLFFQEWARVLGPARVFATLGVNLLGTYWAAWAILKGHPQAFSVAFCGAFTTFSGLIAEGFAKPMVLNALYVPISLVLGFVLLMLFPLGEAIVVFWPTMFVNLLGCFLFGLLSPKLKILKNGTWWEIVILGGFLGGMTTFSALMIESKQLCLAGYAVVGMGNIVIQYVMGSLLFAIGRWASREGRQASGSLM
jgi:fluoride ion exporter CrcB/FEX